LRRPQASRAESDAPASASNELIPAAPKAEISTSETPHERSREATLESMNESSAALGATTVAAAVWFDNGEVAFADMGGGGGGVVVAVAAF